MFSRILTYLSRKWWCTDWFPSEGTLGAIAPTEVGRQNKVSYVPTPKAHRRGGRGWGGEMSVSVSDRKYWMQLKPILRGTVLLVQEIKESNSNDFNDAVGSN